MLASHSSTRTPARPLLLVLIAMTLGIMLICSPGPEATPAGAATPAKVISFGGWSIGAFLSSNGRFSYCIEPGAQDPSGAQQGPTTMSALPGYQAGTFDQTGWNGTVTSGALSGKRLRQINYVLWNHGRTKSSAKAAAVQLAIWMLRADPGANKWLEHHLTWVANHGGQAHLAQAEQLVAEARVKAVVAVAPTPAPLEITFDDDHTGGVVTYPAGTTKLVIEGGLFANESTQMTLPGKTAGSATWVATPFGDDWVPEAEVTVRAKWSGASLGWPSRVTVLPPTVKQQQRLAAGVGPVRTTFSKVLATRAALESDFQPVLSTRVGARELESGVDRFVDTVELEVAEGSSPWPAKGEGKDPTEYAPVTASGVVYGPFDRPQPQHDRAPEGAPIAGTATLEATKGPGEYQVESSAVARDPGYYYWVWEITAEGQPTKLLPTGYEFRDDFGLVEEGHVVPTALRWNTRLVDRTIDPADLVITDRVHAYAKSGYWLRDHSGARIPARVRLTVYQSDSRPARSSAVPDHAEEIARSTVEIRGNAEDTATERSERISLPAGTRGWVTIRACLHRSDQPMGWQGYVEEWCDDYGIPEETAQIVDPAPAPVTPAAPPRLAETGSLSGPLNPTSAAVLGAGLIGSGAGALVLSGKARRRRGVRRSRN